jgi:hypothetical protein
MNVVRIQALEIVAEMMGLVEMMGMETVMGLMLTKNS